MNIADFKNYLLCLGLPVEMASVYVVLVEHPSSTIMAISRQTGINRTKIYRLIEAMQKQGLVSLEVRENTTQISNSPVDQLERLLREKQTMVGKLTKQWGEAERLVEQLTLGKQAETKVKYYQGKAGLEQMIWNVLKTSSEVVGYTFRDLTDFVGEKFMSEFVSEFRRRKIMMRDIYGDEYKEHKHADNDWGVMMNSRYLPREILAIPHQMDIYDNVVTFYSWSEGEVWGTEIYNPKVAQMQKQLFELAWERAKH
jgi:sugar-specific transcriptional regulator TrmB